ncbi:MAG TPA: hypothetical protein VGB39_05185, partial [Sphingomicrobium sp.]
PFHGENTGSSPVGVTKAAKSRGFARKSRKFSHFLAALLYKRLVQRGVAAAWATAGPCLDEVSEIHLDAIEPPTGETSGRSSLVSR